MKSLAEFAKTTLVGGLLVVLPLYLSILLLAKTAAGLVALLAPVTAQIPASVQLREVLAALILIAACFITGLIVRTGPGLRAINAFQQSVLERIPGYGVLRGIAARLSGQVDEATFQPALVEIEDALVPAFIVEELPEGRLVVLVPSVPTPAAGALYVLEAARVHRVDVPITTALRVVTQWGSGTGELVKAMRREGDRTA